MSFLQNMSNNDEHLQPSTSSGGGSSNSFTADQEDDKIVLTVVRLVPNNLISSYCVKLRLNATTLIRLKRLYCNQIGHFGQGRFIYKGQQITDNDTPMSLNMKNDDIIEFYE